MNERRQDYELLQLFTREGEQSAFADVVRRHLDLVFATALRKVEDPGAAQEIAQNVFAALARKAWRFAPDDSLPAWLHKTALLESKSWLRGELRRRRREQTAANLGTTMKTPDDQPALNALVPLLDEALLSLREKDRTALLLRFYEYQSLRDVGAMFGVSEDTAQKRVQSALERLSGFFKRRGFKTATVAAATAALQHTATSASATVASTVVGAALEVAPPALVGLGALIARLASLTRVQTAAVCVALAVVPVGLQLRERHIAGEELRRYQPQLLAAQNEAGYLEGQNGRLRDSVTGLQESLAQADAAAARAAGSAQAFENLKQRIRGPLMAADYRWDDDSEFVRIPKALLPELSQLALAHQPPISPPGVVRPYARELMSLSPQERQVIEDTLQRVAKLQGGEPATVSEADPPASKGVIAAKKFSFRPPGEGGDEAEQRLVEQRYAQMLEALRSVLGEERWLVMPKKFRTVNSQGWNQALISLGPGFTVTAKVQLDDLGSPKASWFYSASALVNEYRNNITKIDVDAVDPVKVGGNVYSQNIVGYVNRSTNLSIFLSNASADQGKQLITFPGLAVPEAFRRRMSEWFHEQAVLPLGGKENP